MTIQIYHKGQWVFLKTWDGGEYTTNEDRACKFTAKEYEAKVAELQSIGIQVKV
jgi:hypothetical protein